MRHAVVVGGGIGGLATARALGRTGWRVTVLEQHDELSAAGAGLVIAPNGIRALASIGLGDALRTIATPMAATGFRRPDGSWLTRVDVGGDTVAVTRPDLHRVLADDLGPTVTVRTGERVTTLPDADLVVGADGIGSAVRDLVTPGVALVDAGYCAWRALVPCRLGPGAELGETLGDGIRFGHVGLGERGVYWYACAPGTPPTTTPAEQLTALAAMFAGWHDPIGELIAATDPDDLLLHPIADVPRIPPMAVGAVALVGDAAHPMTPNLGQGACQALEDAITLAAYVADGDLAAALTRYSADRRRRVGPILRRSRRVGAFVHGSTRFRDLALSAMPAWVGRVGTRSMVSWQPPRSRTAART